MLIMILLPEKIFQLIGVFLCGYSFGYYMVQYLRYKNKEEEIEEFFLITTNIMAQSIEVL